MFINKHQEDIVEKEQYVMLEICFNACKGNSNHEKEVVPLKKDPNWTLAYILNIACGEKLLYNHGGAALSCCMLYFNRDVEAVRVDGKMNGAKCVTVLEKDFLVATKDSRLGLKFTFQLGNNHKHTTRDTEKWILRA